MTDAVTHTDPKEHPMNPMKKAALGLAVAGSTLLGGAVGASLVGVAGAADNTGSTTAPTTAPATAPAAGQADGRWPQGQRPPMDWSKGGHQANNITEEILTGDAATKVTEAAQAAVPGGTVKRVENDAEGATYEAHVETSDGALKTVKLDASFKVTSVEDGMR
ncbi:MAG: hypothetical protein ACOYOP_07950 [Microthrixaceae bacterium]